MTVILCAHNQTEYYLSIIIIIIIILNINVFRVVVVSAWSGGRSAVDQEAEHTRREARKRTTADVYNEEMDSGRVSVCVCVCLYWLHHLALTE